MLSTSDRLHQTRVAACFAAAAATQGYTAAAAGAVPQQPSAQATAATPAEPTTGASPRPVATKAAGLQAAKARAAGADTAGGGSAKKEADAARLAAAAVSPPLQPTSGNAAGTGAGGADPTLGGWDSGRLPGEQSWDENAPDAKLLGALPSLEDGTCMTKVHSGLLAETGSKCASAGQCTICKVHRPCTV